MGIMMSLFGLFTKTDINTGIEQFHNTPHGVLLDVRTRQEYADGHIPGSLNIPLDRIDSALEAIPNKETPVFVYCLSGGRSGQAVAHLKKMGYTDVVNIGGISNYQGKRER